MAALFSRSHVLVRAFVCIRVLSGPRANSMRVLGSVQQLLRAGGIRLRLPGPRVNTESGTGIRKCSICMSWASWTSAFISSVLPKGGQAHLVCLAYRGQHCVAPISLHFLNIYKVSLSPSFFFVLPLLPTPPRIHFPLYFLLQGLIL